MAKWYGVYQSIKRVRPEARWSHRDHSGLLAEVAPGGGGQKSKVLEQKGANRAREAWRFAQKVSKESTKRSSPGDDNE